MPAPGEIRLRSTTKGDRTLFEECKPVSVLATGIIDRQSVQWERKIFGARTSNSESLEALEIVADVFQRDKDGEDVLCPVIACYGAGRAWPPSHAR